MNSRVFWLFRLIHLHSDLCLFNWQVEPCGPCNAAVPPRAFVLNIIHNKTCNWTVDSLVKITEALRLGFPLNCSFGEEKGWRCRENSADYVWVLDPIDGTKSFITGNFLSQFYHHHHYDDDYWVRVRDPKFHLDSACFVSISGKPLFGTLIALLENGIPVSI